MKVLLALLAVATLVSAREDPDVEILTDSNFKNFIKEGTTLVEFYAPWCGHCKKLTPEYAQAATTLKKFGIRLGKVDATIETDLAGRFDISGYPTLKIFRDGEFSTNYEGPRDAAGIASYMKKQGGPIAREFTSFDDAKAQALTIGGVVFVGLFKDAQSAAANAFALAAARERDTFEFAVVYGQTDERIIRVFPTSLARFAGEEETAAFAGDTTDRNAIAAWFFDAALPLAGIADAETTGIYDRVSRPVVTLYVPRVDPVNDGSGTKYFLNRIRKVAAAKPEYVFALTQYGSSPFELITGAGYNIGIRGANGEKYRFDKPGKKFDKADLERFVASHAAGELEEYLKSEDVPAQQGNVKVLVAKNFRAETDGKAGLIEFYAPWCGHCKSLAPIWDKLGEKAAKEAPEVLVAKLDATANDVPAGYEVRGYPTIIYQGADGTKEPYQGGRELADFVKFLKGKGVWQK